ncbi:type 1 glutamine amidotransferase domain-containing protein [Paenibacillus sp. NEAU-GSW1]|uniref:type 1 glutamine amidotransferase domain-containing protein n=1 Tax=Paenibacillus sp. NEAU-GSW1 TaxID=2682486 RepID=UPI0012E2C3B3|nr:type 1 glutamine amidotransferase domain-containing protein [Paenibacillus sp. NEAU-GSW1]MUT65939.1 type 1 glutamine amidotransferase domain-containing protein [Paenibacillus sp. NEAU-GSW1]
MNEASKQQKVLLIVANPSVSTTLGWPVGYWLSELTHAYYELTEAGIEVTIASPQGGKVEMDTYSDPRNPDGYAMDDIVSLGYLHYEPFLKQLEDTPSISQFSSSEFDAVLVAGGMSPMFTFAADLSLQRLFTEFFETGKIASALCHGTALLFECRLADGSPLVQGRTIIGVTNDEEDAFDRMAGQTVMPFRIEDRAVLQGAKFVHGAPFEPYVVRDGNLITGQQQHSGKLTARLVVRALNGEA